MVNDKIRWLRWLLYSDGSPPNRHLVTRKWVITAPKCVGCQKRMSTSYWTGLHKKKTCRTGRCPTGRPIHYPRTPPVRAESLGHRARTSPLAPHFPYETLAATGATPGEKHGKTHIFSDPFGGMTIVDDGCPNSLGSLGFIKFMLVSSCIYSWMGLYTNKHHSAPKICRLCWKS